MSEKPLPEHTPQVHGHLPHMRANPNISIPDVAIFALGRLSDAPLQYLMFTQGWAAGRRGLGPIPTLLTGMYAVAGLRHGYWVLFTSSFRFPTSISLQVIAFNTTINTINTLVAVNALTSSPYPILGDFTDCMVEAVGGPRAFRDWDFDGDNFQGSIVATVALSAMQVLNFLTSGIPEITGYMSVKYGKQWEDYKRRVPLLELTAFPSKLATHLNKHLNNMVDRVQAVGGFHNIWACDAAGGHLNLYEDHLKTFWNHPNYCHMNGLPYVATFSKDGLTNTA
ncbi:hypothetical protein B0H13DRAFT_2301972 [Mycena leptocephala]|nr:hypothetical protein B0H13DRAFT_2301972 [Mycena leptocephala]